MGGNPSRGFLGRESFEQREYLSFLQADVGFELLPYLPQRLAVDLVRLRLEMARGVRQDRPAKASRGNRRRPYRAQVAGVLAAAFALSLAYSVIVTVTGSTPEPEWVEKPTG